MVQNKGSGTEDLFPRGHERGHAPTSKKKGDSNSNGSSSSSKKNRSSKHGVSNKRLRTEPAYTRKRPTPGSTVLCVVERCDARNVTFALPSGFRADADPFETLITPRRLRTRMLDPVQSAMLAADIEDERSDGDDDDDDLHKGIAPLHELLRPGLVVCAAVVERNAENALQKGTKTLAVSLKPRLVNAGINAALLAVKDTPIYAAVQSVEDHGYILSLGAVDTTAFLPFADAHAEPHHDTSVSDEHDDDNNDDDDDEEEGSEESVALKTQRLRKGAFVQVVTSNTVRTAKKRKGANGNRIASALQSVRVTAHPQTVLRAQVLAHDAIKFHQLRAGMRVSAKVVAVSKHRVTLQFASLFSAFVEAAHVPDIHAVAVGHSVTARLICVDPGEKCILASMLPSFVNCMTVPAIPSAFSVGMLLSHLTVRRVHPHLGVYFTASEQSTLRYPHENVDEGERRVSDLSSDHDKSLQQVPLFAHVKKLSDAHISSPETKFPQASQISAPARIVSLSTFDGIVNVDLRKSVLSRAALHISELQPARIYNCKVISHLSSGSIVVAIDGDEHIRGIISSSHVSDTNLSPKILANHPTLRVGAYAKCIVLAVNHKTETAYLSARKSLLNTADPLLTSYEQAASALRAFKHSLPKDHSVTEKPKPPVYAAHVIGAMQSGGLLVEFCNNVRGAIHQSQMNLYHANENEPNHTQQRRSQKEIEALFPTGHVLRVRVQSVNVEKRRLSLSLNLHPSLEASAEEENTYASPKDMPAPGVFVNGLIKSYDESTSQFRVLAKYRASKDPCNKENDDPATTPNTTATTASDQSGQEDTNDSQLIQVECVLPSAHLSDSLPMAQKITSAFCSALKSPSEDSQVEPLRLADAMVLRLEKGRPLLTRKHSLIAAFRKHRLPSSYDELLSLTSVRSAETNPDETPVLAATLLLHGYVKAIVPAGIIVGFLGNLVGFCRKSRIADHFVANPERSLPLGTSVATSVIDCHNDTRRFNVSLRTSDIGEQMLAVYASSLSNDIEFARTAFGKKNVENEFPIGTVIDAKIDAVRPYGVVMKLVSPVGTKAVGVALNSTQPTPKNTPTKLRAVSALNPNNDETSVVSAADDESIVSALAATAADNEQALKTPGVKTRSARKQRKVEEEETVPNTPVRVLDVDPFTGVVDVSQEVRLIETAAKRSSFTGKDSSRATVILVKEEYVILAVQKSKAKTIIAFAPLPMISDNIDIKPGVHVSCTPVPELLLDSKQCRISATVDWSSVAKNAKTKVPEARQGPLKKMIQSLGKDDIQEGQTVNGMVTNLLPFQANTRIARDVWARVHLSNCERLSDSELSTLPLGVLPSAIAARFTLPETGILRGAKVVQVRPLSKEKRSASGKKRIRDEGEHSEEKALIELALRGARNQPYSSGTVLHKGDKIVGFLLGPTKSRGYSLVLTPGTIGICDEIDAIKVADTPAFALKSLAKGTPVLCQIYSVSKHEDEQVIRLTVSSNGTSKGGFFVGRVSKVTAGVGLRVELPWNCRPDGHKNVRYGFVNICDIDDDFENVKSKMENYKAGDFIRVRLVSALPSTEPGVVPKFHEKDMVLTMRTPSTGNSRPKDRLVTAIDEKQLSQGSRIRGFVRGVTENAVFVSIGRYISARVILSELSDSFIAQPEKVFSVGSLVVGTIVNLQTGVGSSATVDLSLRKRKKSAEVVKTVPTPKITASPKYEKTPSPRKVPQSSITDAKCDSRRELKKKRKGKSEESELQPAAAKKLRISEPVENSERGIGSIESNVAASVPENNESSLDAEDEDIENFDENEALEIAHDFNFDEGQNTALGSIEAAPSSAVEDVEMVGSGDEVDEEKPEEEEVRRKSKSSKEKREKKRAREAAEREVQEKEEALAANPNAPETAEDFERLLVGDSNSSAVWIQYMAYRLSLSQIDKARALAERALETIDLRKEVDRVNIWMAYINLEAAYGAQAGAAKSKISEAVDTAAAVFRVFERACKRVTAVKDFHLQVAASMRENNPEIADEVLKRALKQFRQSKEVWIAAGLAKFEAKDLAGGRRLLERAIVALPKDKHLATTMKFSQMEYRHGSVERGRTVFESLIGNYPKRLDMWSVYLDMEIGVCRSFAKDADELPEALDVVRRIFERCSCLDLSSKKMKFVFKKWVGFEKELGSKESLRLVMDRARQYVENKTVALPGGDASKAF